MIEMVQTASVALLLAFSLGAHAGYFIGPPSTVGSLAWSFTAQNGSTLPSSLVNGSGPPPVPGFVPAPEVSCSFLADMTGVLERSVYTNVNLAVYGAVYCGKEGNFILSGAGYVDKNPQVNFTVSNPVNGLALSCLVNVGTTEGKCIARTPGGSGGMAQTYYIDLVPMTSTQ